MQHTLPIVAQYLKLKDLHYKWPEHKCPCSCMYNQSLQLQLVSKLTYHLFQFTNLRRNLHERQPCVPSRPNHKKSIYKAKFWQYFVQMLVTKSSSLYSYSKSVMMLNIYLTPVYNTQKLLVYLNVAPFISSKVEEEESS